MTNIIFGLYLNQYTSYYNFYIPSLQIHYSIACFIKIIHSKCHLKFVNNILLK